MSGESPASVVEPGSAVGPAVAGVTLDPDFEIRGVAAPPAQPATPTRTEEERR